MKSKKNRVYLDYAASTPVDKKGKRKGWANPSSLYQEGREALEILEQARAEVARILNCRSGEIYFTSGGTESANIAIQGVISNAKERGINPHIIISTIEHSAVLETVKNLMKWGVEVSFVNPDEKGIINPNSVEKEIKENTVLVCIMHANNEIGTLQPVAKIGNAIRNYRRNKKLDRREPLIPYPYFFVDACQSAEYENIALERLYADILILDGIKIYGPRGTGILAVKHGLGISSITHGGGQEKNLRPGTENVEGAVEFAKALKLTEKLREKESARLTKLRDYAINKILAEISGSSLNGHPTLRLPNNINICFASPKPQAKAGFADQDSEFLVIKLDTLGFSVSSASACLSNKDENSSYVIEAIGKPECAGSSLRFTLGRETKKQDLDKLIKALKSILKN